MSRYLLGKACLTLKVGQRDYKESITGLDWNSVPVNGGWVPGIGASGRLVSYGGSQVRELCEQTAELAMGWLLRGQNSAVS